MAIYIFVYYFAKYQSCKLINVTVIFRYSTQDIVMSKLSLNGIYIQHCLAHAELWAKNSCNLYYIVTRILDSDFTCCHYIQARLYIIRVLVYAIVIICDFRSSSNVGTFQCRMSLQGSCAEFNADANTKRFCSFTLCLAHVKFDVS